LPRQAVNPGLGKGFEERILFVRLRGVQVDARLTRQALVGRLVVVAPPERQERSFP
jgi:hypothetical protein